MDGVCPCHSVCLRFVRVAAGGLARRRVMGWMKPPMTFPSTLKVTFHFGMRGFDLQFSLMKMVDINVHDQLES